MTLTPSPVDVRYIVRRIFSELGVDSQSLELMEGNILIDEGQIRARSYRIDDLMAMWLMDVGLVQFYDEEGNLLRRANLLAEIEPRKMAA